MSGVKNVKNVTVLVVVVIVVSVLWYHGVFDDMDAGDGRISYATTAELQSARTKVDDLQAAGRAPRTGYSREEFGKAWADVDKNGCDTRNDVLGRDYSDVVYADARGCKVGSGTLVDPYSGEVLTKPADSDIDHIVALSNAWQMGAWRWGKDKRVAFANDPDNLLAVSASQNRQKGDADAATWLPKNKAYRCTYVAKQVEIKHAYGLRVTKAERDAITDLLDECLARQ